VIRHRGEDTVEEVEHGDYSIDYTKMEDVFSFFER